MRIVPAFPRLARKNDHVRRSRKGAVLAVGNKDHLLYLKGRSYFVLASRSPSSKARSQSRGKTSARRAALWAGSMYSMITFE